MEDPELPGKISLLFFIKGTKEKEGMKDPELSGEISFLILIRNNKEKEFPKDFAKGFFEQF